MSLVCNFNECESIINWCLSLIRFNYNLVKNSWGFTDIGILLDSSTTVHTLEVSVKAWKVLILLLQHYITTF